MIGSTGNMLLAGGFAGTVDFGGGPMTAAGRGEGFILELDEDGGHVWSDRLGVAGALALDVFDNFIVAGSSVLKLSPALAEVWEIELPGYASAQVVVSDSSANIIVAGSFEQTVDLGGGPLVAQGGDIFIVSTRLDAARFG